MVRESIGKVYLEVPRCKDCQKFQKDTELGGLCKAGKVASQVYSGEVCNRIGEVPWVVKSEKELKDHKLKAALLVVKDAVKDLYELAKARDSASRWMNLGMEVMDLIKEAEADGQDCGRADS